jgi:hypothetical protein
MARFILVLLIAAAALSGAHRAASPSRSPDPGSNVASSLSAATGTLTIFDSLATEFDDYGWPTEAGRIVTSTFGEFRRTHFHGGIDISSGDMTGYRVYAARTGYVARIRVGPTGYGKMLYVRHPDGYTTTYAHLQKFSPAINARAAAEQQRRERFTVDFDCTPDEFPVARGDLIAFSGETGTGSPHLHFEIRDGRMNPLNPFLAPLLRVHDTIAPTIRRIAVFPVGPGSTVDGREGVLISAVRPAGARRSLIPHPIVITGAAGIAIDARDRINGSRFRNGTYGHSLSIDGTPVFDVRLNRTPAQQSHEIGIYYDEAMLADRRGRFEKLFMDLPNDLPFYAPRAAGAGIVDLSRLSRGAHAFTIVTTDFNGNSAEVSGTLVVSRAPEFDALRRGDNLFVRFFEPGGLRRLVVATRTMASGWSYRTFLQELLDTSGTLTIALPPGRGEILKVTAENNWGVVSAPRIILTGVPAGPPAPMTLNCETHEDGVFVRATTGGVFTTPPAVSATEGDARYTVVMVPTDVNDYRGWFRPGTSFRGARMFTAEAGVNGRPAGAGAAVELYPIAPLTAGTLTLDGGRFTLGYDSLSVLSPLFLRYEKTVTGEGTVYALAPASVILRDGLSVSIADSAGGRRGLFFRTGGRWELIGRRATGLTTGRIRRTLGELALLADDDPPVVSHIRIAGTSGRRPVIRFRFHDALAGIEYDELKVYIDSAVVIPEIDGEHHRALLQFPEPLERGSHQLTIHLKDRMGNATTAERRFVLR